MKHIIKSILFVLALSCIASSQTQDWRDINGSPNFTLLREAGNGTIFATFGTQPTSDPTLGLFYSTDGGLSWLKTQFNTYVEELVCNGSKVLVTRPDSRSNYTRNFSSDNGATWITMNGVTNIFPAGFIISDTGGIYSLAFDFGLQIATYDIPGRRWRTFGSNPGFPNNNSISAFMMDHAQNIFIGSAVHGISYSTNQGVSWNRVLTNREIGTMLTTSKNDILLGTNPRDSLVGGVYRSLDTGKTWTSLGLIQRTIVSLVEDSSGNIYANTSSGIYRYNEIQRTWNNVGPRNTAFESILVTQSNVLLATSSTLGVFRSTDFGSTWFKPTTLTGENITAICVDQDNYTYVGTLGNRIYKSAQTGSGWYQTPSGVVGGEVNAFAKSGTVVFAGTDEGLFSSSNHGVDWKNMTSAFFGGAVYDVAVNAANDVFVTSNFGLYRSTDGGEHWISAGLSSYGTTRLCITPQNTIFVNTTANGIYSSTNNGETWNYSGLVDSGIVCLTADAYGTVFAGGFAKVYRSTDNGSSWMSRSVGTGQIFNMVTNGYHVFAGTPAGVYNSVDNGVTWSAMSLLGLKQTTVLSLAFDNNSNLIVGTYLGGVYAYNQTITAVRPIGELPTETRLLQNYPNPFNPTTILSFVIRHSSFVTLKIYNILGEEVSTLIDEVKEPGEYSVPWNATGFSSGVYFYRLQTTGYSEMKKMVLVR